MVFMRIINAARYRAACKRVAVVSEELLWQGRMARTDIRLGGHVWAFRLSIIAGLEEERQALALRFNATVETMRLNGVRMGA